MVCDATFAPSDATYPSNPARSKGQHQLPTKAGKETNKANNEEYILLSTCVTGTSSIAP